MDKIGRNQRCPCGSGKKYKRCHGDPTSAVETAAVGRVASFARIAQMRHQARQKEIDKQFGWEDHRSASNLTATRLWQSDQRFTGHPPGRHSRIS